MPNIGDKIHIGYRTSYGQEFPAVEVFRYEIETLGNEHMVHDLQIFLSKYTDVSGLSIHRLLLELEKLVGKRTATWVMLTPEEVIERYCASEEDFDGDDGTIDHDSFRDCVTEVTFKNGIIVADDGDDGYLVI